MCLVVNELYSGGLMTFRCLSTLTASGRRVSPFSFASRRDLGGKWGNKGCVFAIMDSFREQTVKRPPEIWSITISEWYGRGMCLPMKFMDFFFTLYFLFSQCFSNALIPLGYDSDLQRICIIKLVEKLMIYTSNGAFLKLVNANN